MACFGTNHYQHILGFKHLNKVFVTVNKKSENVRKCQLEKFIMHYFIHAGGGRPDSDLNNEEISN